MKHSLCKRGSTVGHSQAGCAKPNKDADRRNSEAASPASPDHHGLPFGGLMKSIFGAEKVERLSTAVRFSFGDAIFPRVGGERPQLKRFGLLLVLLFLQSLFIAIDYLPVTLEVLGRNNACGAVPGQQERPSEQPGNLLDATHGGS